MHEIYTFFPACRALIRTPTACQLTSKHDVSKETPAQCFQLLYCPFEPRYCRKPAQVEGVLDPTEPEHITVTYKQRNKDLGTRHVYTDQESTSDKV